MPTKKTIKLKSKGNKVKKSETIEVSFEHALNILRGQVASKLSAWTLVESNWEFKDNEISKRPRRNSDS